MPNEFTEIYEISKKLDKIIELLKDIKANSSLNTGLM